MDRLGKYLVFGLTAVLVLVAVTFLLVRELTTTSATGEVEMALNAHGTGVTCDGSPSTTKGAVSQPDECTMDPGTAFTLSVEAVKAPAAGYIGVQTFIDYGSDLVYNKGATAADEIVWPDLNTSVALRGQTGAGLVNHGGLSSLLPPFPVSSYTGNVVELSFTCSAGNSATDVRLLPLGDTSTTPPAGTDGAGFAEPPDGTTQQAASDTLTINCGAAAVDTDTPTPTATTEVVEDTPTPTSTTEGDTPTPTSTTEGDTPTPTSTTVTVATATPTATPTSTTVTVATSTPTSTETPEAICGDVNDDGTVDSTDALWVLWFEAALSDDVPDPEVADLNEDSTIDSVDALFILWIEGDLWSCP